MTPPQATIAKVMLSFALPLPGVGPLSAQDAPAMKEPKPPQVKLEIVPLKKTYLVGETVLVKYKLTSLVDGTLCFPTPAGQSQQFVTGYVETDATRAVDGGYGDQFIEHFWERHPSEERLRSEVVDRWVKLGMSEPFKLKRASAVTVLTQQGDWVLQSTYHPPQLSPHEKAVIESLGCTTPDAEIRSAPVAIRVINAPE